jgi:N-acetylmuramoyl-L-alanine amidase
MYLRIEDTGNEVSQIQTLLNKSINAGLTVDGHFGKKTQQAVKDFQKINKLKVDGIVGQKTYSELLVSQTDKHELYEKQGDYDIEDNPNEFINNNSKYIWIIDAGHGGMIDGKYVTPGKRSPKVPPGVYEGVVNRQISKYLYELLIDNDIDCVLLVPENEDVSLGERVRRANKIHKETHRCRYVSIHCNAAGNGNEWNMANGIDTFYDKNSSGSRNMAKTIQDRLIEFTKRRDRGIKQANFYVLRSTLMPAVLCECGFMTNYEEAVLLSTDEYQKLVAHSILEGIFDIEDEDN